MVPDGWKLVPIEPTLAMGAAYKLALKEYIERHGPDLYRSKRKRGGRRVPEDIKIRIRWRAMVQAAPLTPAERKSTDA
jgi:hypothetical protein